MMTPLLHRILVKPEQFKEYNKDYVRAKAMGLEIPELEDMKRAQASVDVGTVVSLGATAYKDYGIDAPVKVGDRVNYARFAGKLVQDNATNEEFICLNDEDLICVIKE